jgi:hypothetical protein
MPGLMPLSVAILLLFKPESSRRVISVRVPAIGYGLRDAGDVWGKREQRRSRNGRRL